MMRTPITLFGLGWLIGVVLMLTGCVAGNERSASMDVVSNSIDAIEGVGPCSADNDYPVRISKGEPMVILVHGCFGSAARFQALSEVFQFHGQQSICFSYDDRDSLDRSAEQLRTAIGKLVALYTPEHITLIGHSQGGLIARRAVSTVASTPAIETTPLQLVTISSPFAGIRAADHCASPTAKLLSLGLVIPICKLISGDKWYDITHASSFIQQPGSLHTNISSHLKIVTDERDSCRRWDEWGRCSEDDYVFSLDEQYHSPVDSGDTVRNRQVKAGHAAIVGDEKVVPKTLIRILQQEGVMHQTRVSERVELHRLLKRLY